MNDTTSPVAFLDVGATYRELQPSIDQAVARVLTSGWYILGPEVEAFEKEFARSVGARHCVGVANGLDALVLGLAARGIGPDDEVIVPSNTYIATWIAATRVGARVVPVEPDPTTFNIDPKKVESAVTARTKAIVPVHLYGLPAEMDAIADVARRHGLFLFDDAAQAHGARYKDRTVGALADATAWSFYPGKNLGAFGDGGAITTDDDGLAATLNSLRNYGSSVKYENDLVGYNSRLDPLQAAVLRAKLPHLEAWNARRETIAQLYSRELSGLEWLRLPRFPEHCRSALHLFVVQCEDRARVQEHLSRHGVQTLVHYPIPPHRQVAYSDLGFPEGSFPISERLHREVLSLPMGPHLTQDDAMRVVRAVRSYQ